MSESSVNPLMLLRSIATSAGVVCISAVLSNPVAANPRNSFPGRRVGGGTRGECTSRVLAHLVPETSVMGLPASREVGLVQGPSSNPVSLTMQLRPEQGGEETIRQFPAASAGITLTTLDPIKSPLIWESSFDCESAADSGKGDPLAFVAISAPPALSLLLPSQDPADQPVLQALGQLRKQCGQLVPTKSTLAGFGLDDLITAGWPERLPVRCSN